MTADPARTRREAYRAATDFRKEAFTERPYIGSPAAPAQDETNTSRLWYHLNAGFLSAYEYTRWWKESRALRNAAVLGDWSWLSKVRITGPEASAFVNYATVKDLTSQAVGQVMFTPMVNRDGHVAIEGLTYRLGEDEYLFTQSGAYRWLTHLREVAGMDVELEDVTPDYTCYAVQGPRSRAVVEALTGEGFGDLPFSRFRETTVLDTAAIVDRQGVTGERGYEFLMRTGTGKAADLWRAIRDVGREYDLREIGFRAQQIGHTEAGYATAVRDYLPARVGPEDADHLAKHWISREELDAIDWDLAEHFCSPGELGWASRIDVEGEFHGRTAVEAERRRGGPDHRFVALRWDTDDVVDLFAAQFDGGPSAPPPKMASGQHRMLYLRAFADGEPVGWASGVNYSPNLRRMISNARLEEDVADAGTRVEVAWGGFTTDPVHRIGAEVADHPLVEHRALG